MKAYTINYDLKAPNRNYDGLFVEIKKSPKWWHFLESTWIIATDETPSQIWNRLIANLDKNDYLLIIEVKDNVQGWLPKEAWDWIHANVPS
ncbi:MAG: hypothetical protein HY761_00435 [Candidatus Omnitrophica bacterium]|nr:hypothetical protein [Candidatus Omnitrophota bacterium]